jgi:DNA adenine methylase
LEELRHFHQKAQRATFQVLDFQEAMAQAQPGDVVYCDPPYVPLSATAHFTSYSANAFGPAEQLALAASAQALTEREIPVLISNHDTATTRQAYEQAKTIVSKDVQRFISCRGSHRKPAAELLAIFE